MKTSFAEYKGVLIVVKESYYGQVYEFNDVTYQRYYEVTHAINLWLENSK